MDLTIRSKDTKYEWSNGFILARWKSRNETKKPLFYKSSVSKKRIFGDVAKLADSEISEELVVILSHITELVGIAIYEEEQEVELLVGESLFSTTHKVIFPLKNNSVVKLLEGR